MKWREIGMAAVDSGMLMICDPCYVCGEKYPQYNHILDYMTGEDGECLDAGGIPFAGSQGTRMGLAVVSSTTHGDGCYPVFGLYESKDHTRPLALTVVTDGSVLETLEMEE